MTNMLARQGGRALRRAGPGPRAAGVAVLVLSAAVLSACGGGSGQAAAKSQATTTLAAASGPTTTTARASAGPAGAGAAFTGPAASGTIASISGDTLEVQNTQSGQTTVDLTTKTRISATAEVTLAAVKAGDCVTASGTKGSGTGLAATSVTLVARTGGSCTAFGQPGAQRDGRFGFERSGGGGFTRPTGTFTRPTGSGGSPPARPADLRTVTGTVKSVSGSTIEVSGFLRSFRFSPGAGTSTSTTVRPAATTIAVTVGSATRYQRVGTATVASLKVGECATAFGSSNDIGAVTATRLSVAPATGGSCDTGFGAGGAGFGGRFPGGGAAGNPAGVPAGTAAVPVNPGAAS